MTRRRLLRLLTINPNDALPRIAAHAIDASPPRRGLILAGKSQGFDDTSQPEAIVLAGMLSESQQPLTLLGAVVGALAPGGKLGLVELTADPDFAAEFPGANAFVRQTVTLRPAFSYVPVLEQAGLEVLRAEVRPQETGALAKALGRAARLSLRASTRHLGWELAEATESNLLMLAMWICVKPELEAGN